MRYRREAIVVSEDNLISRKCADSCRRIFANLRGLEDANARQETKWKKGDRAAKSVSGTERAAKSLSERTITRPHARTTIIKISLSIPQVMQHNMKLNDGPYERIKTGTKNIEIRLYDEKRQSVNLRDIITFSKLSSPDERLIVEVVGLLRYNTFEDLVKDVPMKYFGYPDTYDKQSFIDSIYHTYTREEEAEYGVLGIKIKLV